MPRNRAEMMWGGDSRRMAHHLDDLKERWQLRRVQERFRQTSDVPELVLKHYLEKVFTADFVRPQTVPEAEAGLKQAKEEMAHIKKRIGEVEKKFGVKRTSNQDNERQRLLDVLFYELRIQGFLTVFYEVWIKYYEDEAGLEKDLPLEEEAQRIVESEARIRGRVNILEKEVGQVIAQLQELLSVNDELWAQLSDEAISHEREELAKLKDKYKPKRPDEATLEALNLSRLALEQNRPPLRFAEFVEPTSLRDALELLLDFKLLEKKVEIDITHLNTNRTEKNMQLKALKMEEREYYLAVIRIINVFRGYILNILHDQQDEARRRRFTPQMMRMRQQAGELRNQEKNLKIKKTKAQGILDSLQK